MKKGIIIAIAMILLGIVLIMAGGIAVRFDFKMFANNEYTERTVEINEAFENIFIEGGDIRLLPSEDGKCTAIFKESEKISYSTNVEDGVLDIKRNDERKWYDHIGFDIGNFGVTLYLPEAKYNTVNIKSFSGRIEVSEGVTIHHANLNSISGSIRCYAVVEDNLFAECKSGSMDISGTNARGITLSSTSGSIKLSDIVAARQIDISKSSGSITTSNIKCENMDIRTSSGSTTLNSVVASGKINVKSSSGSIKLDACDANEFMFKSTSGSIRGTILSDKVFNVHTTSGSIDVPASVEGSGIFNADVTSGSVKITVE